MGSLIPYSDLMHGILAVVVHARRAHLRSRLLSFVIAVRLS